MTPQSLPIKSILLLAVPHGNIFLLPRKLQNMVSCHVLPFFLAGPCCKGLARACLLSETMVWVNPCCGSPTLPGDGSLKDGQNNYSQFFCLRVENTFSSSAYPILSPSSFRMYSILSLALPPYGTGDQL